MTVMPPIRALFGQPNACFGCRMPEPAITNPTRFIHNEIELIICQWCERDYFEWAGEDIAETVSRSDCDPRELLFWSGRRH
jgi:hypothetical protein